MVLNKACILIVLPCLLSLLGVNSYCLWQALKAHPHKRSDANNVEQMLARQLRALPRATKGKRRRDQQARAREGSNSKGNIIWI